MSQRKLRSLSDYRRRLKQRGVVRVEVHVHKNDAALVRGMWSRPRGWRWRSWWEPWENVCAELKAAQLH